MVWISVVLRVVFSRPYVDIFSTNMGIFRVAAHAPTKYQSNSTSGRGARASYRTMLPEISARRSLLEPSFRYLSPGREGEKCRPLDHTWQIPFVHSARLMIGSNSDIYQSIPVFSSMWYVQVLRWCIFIDCTRALAETFFFMIQSRYRSCVIPYGAGWCILARGKALVLL